MKIEVRNTHKNALLSREEITAEAFFEGKTPSRIDVHKEMAKKLGVSPDLIVVKGIKTHFGEEKAQVTIHKYESNDILDTIEPAHVKKRLLPKGKKEEQKGE